MTDLIRAPFRADLHLSWPCCRRSSLVSCVTNEASVEWQPQSFQLLSGGQVRGDISQKPIRHVVDGTGSLKMLIRAGRGGVSLLIIIHKSDERRCGFCRSVVNSEKQAWAETLEFEGLKNA